MSDRDERPGIERPLEALVFAPLGFVLEARQMYPRFVDRGRNQILLARLVGRYATRQAMAAAGGALERNAGPATPVLRLVGLAPDEPTDDRATDDRTTEAPAAPERGPVAAVVDLPVPPGPAARPSDGAAAEAPAADGPVPGTSGDEGAPPAEPPAADPSPPVDVPEVASLAIPDYDSLAASQVVPRLDALTPDELEAVRRYEAGVRGRKTILAKISQLQTA